MPTQPFTPPPKKKQETNKTKEQTSKSRGLTDVLCISATKELVKPVEGAFALVLAHTARLFQQVRVNRRPNDKARSVKVDADKLALLLLTSGFGVCTET